MRRAAPWLCLFFACDGATERASTTVEREHAPVHEVGDAIAEIDDSSAPTIDALDDPNGPPEVGDTTPETIIDTTPETIIDTTPETIIDTTPETIVDTTSETIVDTTSETIIDTTAETIADTTPETIVDTSADIAPEIGEPGEPCQVGALSGTCLHIEDCHGEVVAAEGFCAGGRQIRCCLARPAAWERCSAERNPGVCMDAAECPAPAWKTTSGLCPGPAAIRCCTASAPAPACDPVQRPAVNDGLVEEAGDPGCPDGMARVSASLCIDRFEAALVSAADSSVGLSPYHNPGAAAARAVSVRWAVPQGYIDQVRAESACQAAGKRLCTTDEWLLACRGDAGWTYPYGPAREPGRCNDDRRQHVAVEYFGTTASWIYSEIDNACLAQLPASLDLAGENDGCTTPTGVHDLMGNLHEWVADLDGTFRGGFFDDTVINGEGCLYRTTAHDVHHWDYSTGFRCCADPQ